LNSQRSSLAHNGKVNGDAQSAQFTLGASKLAARHDSPL